MSDDAITIPPSQSFAVGEILSERIRQDAKWGLQNHDPFTWLAILHEETGEVAKAALELRFGTGTKVHLLHEAIQTAAVAMAIVECLRRDTWTWPTNQKSQ